MQGSTTKETIKTILIRTAKKALMIFQNVFIAYTFFFVIYIPCPFPDREYLSA